MWWCYEYDIVEVWLPPWLSAKAIPEDNYCTVHILLLLLLLLLLLFVLCCTVVDDLL